MTNHGLQAVMIDEVSLFLLCLRMLDSPAAISPGAYVTGWHRAGLSEMAGTRQLSLLLILAALGAALILYRLALIGERHSKPVSRPRQPRDGSTTPAGSTVWKKRIVAVGDLHGGTLSI